MSLAEKRAVGGLKWADLPRQRRRRKIEHVLRNDAVILAEFTFGEIDLHGDRFLYVHAGDDLRAKLFLRRSNSFLAVFDSLRLTPTS